MLLPSESGWIAGGRGCCPGPGRCSAWPDGRSTVGGAYLIERAWTATLRVHLERPELLVTGGPYAVSRNPMYVGWALLHLGVGVGRGSGWIIAVFPAAAAQVHREVRREERDADSRLRSGLPAVPGDRASLPAVAAATARSPVRVRAASDAAPGREGTIPHRLQPEQQAASRTHQFAASRTPGGHTPPRWAAARRSSARPPRPSLASSGCRTRGADSAGSRAALGRPHGTLMMILPRACPCSTRRRPSAVSASG